jgi:hypothetical protein
MMQIKDKETITLKEASKLSGYSPDYIGQLIRQGKLPGKQIYSAVSWVTTEEAVLSYVESGKSGTQAKEYAALGLSAWGVDEWSRLYIYVGRVLAGVLIFVSLMLFYIFSVTADQYITTRLLPPYYGAR